MKSILLGLQPDTRLLPHQWDLPPPSSWHFDSWNQSFLAFYCFKRTRVPLFCLYVHISCICFRLNSCSIVRGFNPVPHWPSSDFSATQVHNYWMQRFVSPLQCCWANRSRLRAQRQQDKPLLSWWWQLPVPVGSYPFFHLPHECKFDEKRICAMAREGHRALTPAAWLQVPKANTKRHSGKTQGGAEYKQHSPDLPTDLFQRFGPKRISKNASRWLSALSTALTAKASPVISKEISERDEPASELAHTTAKPRSCQRRQWDYTVFALAWPGEPGPRPHRISEIPLQGNFRQPHFSTLLLSVLRERARTRGLKADPCFFKTKASPSAI